MNKEIKQKITIDSFLSVPDKSLEELSIYILNNYYVSISTSSIQRYLNDKDFIIANYNLYTYNFIKMQLSVNKNNGNIKGGTNSYLNNDVLRSRDGKIIKTIPRNNSLDLDYFEKQLYYIANLFLYLPDYSLEELANYINSAYSAKITKNFIYRSLTNSRLIDIIGIDLFNAIQEQLKINRIEGNRKGANTTNSKNR